VKDTENSVVGLAEVFQNVGYGSGCSFAVATQVISSQPCRNGMLFSSEAAHSVFEAVAGTVCAWAKRGFQRLNHDGIVSLNDLFR